MMVGDEKVTSPNCGFFFHGRHHFFKPRFRAPGEHTAESPWKMRGPSMLQIHNSEKSSVRVRRPKKAPRRRGDVARAGRRLTLFEVRRGGGERVPPCPFLLPRLPLLTPDNHPRRPAPPPPPHAHPSHRHLPTRRPGGKGGAWAPRRARPRVHRVRRIACGGPPAGLGGAAQRAPRCHSARAAARRASRHRAARGFGGKVAGKGGCGRADRPDRSSGADGGVDCRSRTRCGAAGGRAEGPAAGFAGAGRQRAAGAPSGAARAGVEKGVRLVRRHAPLRGKAHARGLLCNLVRAMRDDVQDPERRACVLARAEGKDTYCTRTYMQRAHHARPLSLSRSLALSLRWA